MSYYIGIDGGGTKTDFILCNESGEILARKRYGSASHKQIGISGVVELLRRGIHDLLEEAGLKERAQYYGCFGMPLFGEFPEYDRQIENDIKQELASCHIRVVNDAQAGWAGSLGMQPGINVVAGTGSIGFGVNDEGKTAKAGGWSEFFSDEGSCNWIGRRTIEYFAKEADERLPKGALYYLVRAHLQLTRDVEIIEKIEEEYVPSRDKMASLQLILKEAALAGDVAASYLYEEAAEELSLIVGGVYRQLFDERTCLVSCSGGLFQAGDCIMVPFQKKLAEYPVTLVPPRLDPACGALLLASSFGDGKLTAELLESERKNAEVITCI
ncbi:N-acetylglucosamine kinase [Diplocloster hominis]|uniref:N-acetylglucosamine kinase n=1 Tax=Diplocloster hominis TaxID=3079010 RepID=UPI0031BAD648